MILNNTQANIFKVNGGIANNFANRPAASGSFYIFYSIDTQEIYYDNGSWIKIAGVSIPTPPVNIYNTNGTLTADRTVLGSNTHGIAFNAITYFSANANDGIESGAISINRLGATFSQQSSTLNTRVRINADYQFIELSRSQNNSPFNGTYLKIDIDRFGIANTLTNFITNNFNGLDINFVARTYLIGQISGFNNTYLNISDINRQITTFYNGNNIGLNFAYQAQRYNFGHITNNGVTLQIENAVSQLTVLCNPVQSGGSSNGIFLDLTNNRNYLFGQFNGGSQTHLRVSDLNAQITTNFSGSINGINLRQSSHTFGFISGTNTNTLRFNSNLTVGFYYNNLLNGLNIQHESTISGLERYDFGKLYGASGTQYKITLTDLSCFLNYKNIAQWGLTATQAEFGFTPGSGSNILLDSSGLLNLRQLTQILINGTGITQGTSGSVSGQHLKVKINNVDYVIELRNP